MSLQWWYIFLFSEQFYAPVWMGDPTNCSITVCIVSKKALEMIGMTNLPHISKRYYSKSSEPSLWYLFTSCNNALKLLSCVMHVYICVRYGELGSWVLSILFLLVIGVLLDNPISHLVPFRRHTFFPKRTLSLQNIRTLLKKRDFLSCLGKCLTFQFHGSKRL